MAAPTGFPLRDRGTYLADLGGKPVAVTLNTIPHAVNSDRMQAAWMLEKGCVAQVEALLKTAH
jgi:primosomal protein N''